jgi:SAM-dependent methyltransferase/methyltransferase-like protein
MTDPQVDSYNRVPYDSGPVTSSHPDSMAAMAMLHGMSPAPPGRCRVLELGCSTGGNLLGMAVSLPGSTFVGIDLSPRQIADARAVAAAAGLANVELRAASITDVGDDWGTFDYIVCHGVYSWVPGFVRDAIFRVCSRNLAPNGVAYVSYNTYPGWHARTMVREMILFHDDPTRPPLERVARGRAFVEFLTRHAALPNSVYRADIEQELFTLRDMTDSHFLHEELEAVNDPVYFAEFVHRSEAAGLQYLTEGTFSHIAAALADEARAALREWAPDPIRHEQYLDFLRGRTFRRTLLCPAGVSRLDEPSPDALTGLYLAARAAPLAGAGDPNAVIVEEFRSPDGRTVETNHPLVRAALHTLFDELPDALPFAELWGRANERAAGAPRNDGEDERWFAAAMLQCATGRLVGLHAEPGLCAGRIGPRPTASRLARLEAGRGQAVTNLRHHRVELLPLDRVLLAQMDGAHARPALVDLVRGAVERGEVNVDGDGQSPNGDLADVLDASIRRLARAALLVG